MKKGILLLLVVFSPFTRAEELRIITINLGMLPIGSSAPHLKERQERLGESVRDVIDRTDFDIMAIQEAWTNTSLNVLEHIDSNYRLITLQDNAILNVILKHDTGLAFLVKKSLNADAIFTDYDTAESYVCVFGQVCDRGMLELRLEYGDRKISVINTHLTPFPGLWRFRRDQIYEIVNYRNRLLATGTVDAIILAGDLNLSPSHDNLKSTRSQLQKNLLRDTQIYDGFFSGMWGKRCIDTYEKSLVSPDFLFTHDEPKRRIDHIFVCDKRNWSVKEVRWEFDTFYMENNKKFRISDHYGVYGILMPPVP